MDHHLPTTPSNAILSEQAGVTAHAHRYAGKRGLPSDIDSRYLITSVLGSRPAGTPERPWSFYVATTSGSKHTMPFFQLDSSKGRMTHCPGYKVFISLSQRPVLYLQHLPSPRDPRVSTSSFFALALICLSTKLTVSPLPSPVQATAGLVARDASKTRISPRLSGMCLSPTTGLKAG